ncbi:MAG: phospho-N-acetylmuramoyl-pentapeptide-transferase, partial [Candidatus Bipolaricaulia bacterium]
MSTFLVPLVVAFVASLAGTRGFIERMQRSETGQPIRDFGPTIHAHKEGTPTGGGLIPLAVLAFGAVLASQMGILGAHGMLFIAAALAFGAVGMIDDAVKLAQRHAKGLAARYKLMIQIALAVGWVGLAHAFVGLDRALIVPFGGTWQPDVVLAGVIAVFVLVGTVNALNITDGLDGLAGGVGLIALAAFIGLIAQISVDSGLVMLAGMLATALLGFLIWNVHPARVFLGDCGAMGLGGALAALAVLTRTELLLPLIALVPLLETLSVMVQVPYYKLTGHRIFKVSPLHHHFERAKGVETPFLLPDAEWPEGRITLVFWGVA